LFNNNLLKKKEVNIKQINLVLKKNNLNINYSKYIIKIKN